MRFAISLLSVLAIASVIGTVLKQNEPMPNYVNQFGPFWFDVFGKLGLYSVYSAWWFLLILAFLVIVDLAVHRAQCAASMLARHAQLARERARTVAAQFPSQGRMA